jgi:cytoskeletal protein RodZ
MTSSDTPSPATAAAGDDQKESGGFSTMIRCILFIGLILIGAAIFVRWKGHHATTPNTETPQTVAVQTVPASAPPASPSSASAPSVSSIDSAPKQLLYDPALSTQEIAAIYAKVTTKIDEERASRLR